MSNRLKIQKLIDHAFSGSNADFKQDFGTINKSIALKIKRISNIDLTGARRVISAHSFRHIIKQHGSESKEKRRGQIAVNTDDFFKIIHCLQNPTEIEFVGLNKRKQPSFKYTYKDSHYIYIVEAYRSNKKEKILELSTMYKKTKS